MNLYGFAGGDPVNFSDPFGLCPPCRMSDPGLALLAKREGGAQLEIYKDFAGYQTIGVGHLLRAGEAEKYSNGISASDATALFKTDVGGLVNPQLDRITADLNQNQVDAIGSLIYNAPGAFSKHVLPLLNKGDFAGAKEQMATINKSGGKVQDDLTKRRQGEIRQFDKPVSP